MTKLLKEYKSQSVSFKLAQRIFTKLGIAEHCIKLIYFDISKKRQSNRYCLEPQVHVLYEALFEFLELLVLNNTDTQKIFLPHV